VKRILTRLLATAGLLLVIVTFSPAVKWWTRLLSGPWYHSQGDVLIVLTSDGDAGLIGEFSYWRAVYAVRTWQEGGWKEMIVTGGGGTAESMRAFVLAQGVPGYAVRVEEKSASTRENALFTAAMLHPGDGRKKVLLTSDYHMFRAIRAFRKAGVSVEPLPIPDAGKRANHYAWRWPVFFGLAVETAKICGYAVRGWI
jgi:uncharacterized SAM-binding protein YcdF (DUF218 family)